MTHDPELIMLIAKALHEATGMHSVRWADIARKEKGLRIEQACVALNTISKWEKEKNNG